MNIDSNAIFKDLVDDTIKRDSRISSNQIPFRQGSLQNSRNRYKKFRMDLYGNQVNAEKEKTSLEPTKTMDAPKEVPKSEPAKAEVIVNLETEKKINILPRENVPTKFVRRRAIKLKGKMMNGVVLGGKYAYAVEPEKEKASFDEPVVLENPAVTPDAGFKTIDPVMKESVINEPVQIDVQKISDDNEEAIKNDINEAMNEAEVVDSAGAVEEEIPVELKISEEPSKAEEVPLKVENVVEDPVVEVPEPVLPVEVSIPPVVEVAVPNIEEKSEKEKPLRDDSIQVVDDTREKAESVLNNAEIAPNEDSFDTVVLENNSSSKSIKAMREQLEEMKAKLLKTVASVDDARKIQDDTEVEEKKVAEDKATAKEKLEDVMKRFSATCDGYAQEIKANEDLRESILNNVNERKEKIASQIAETDSYVEQRKEIESILSSEDVKRR